MTNASACLRREQIPEPNYGAAPECLAAEPQSDSKSARAAPATPRIPPKAPAAALTSVCCGPTPRWVFVLPLTLSASAASHSAPHQPTATSPPRPPPIHVLYFPLAYRLLHLIVSLFWLFLSRPLLPSQCGSYPLSAIFCRWKHSTPASPPEPSGPPPPHDTALLPPLLAPPAAVTALHTATRVASQNA